MRSTINLYGPKHSLSAKTPEAINKMVGEVFSKLGFAFGAGVLESKMGKALAVFVNDAIRYVLQEYPDVPDGAIIEVVSSRFSKMELKEKLQRIVDIYHDGQQELLRELANSKLADKWSRIQQQEAEPQYEEPVEQEDDQEYASDLADEDIEPVEPIEYEEPVEPTDVEPVEAEHEAIEHVEQVEPVEKQPSRPSSMDVNFDKPSKRKKLIIRR